jgi:hypothetical protein
VEVVGLKSSSLSGGNLKSNDESVRTISDLLEVANCVYQDATASCLADVSDLRDLVTIRSRVKDEGLSFLTITLPQFAKDFERSLADGFVDPTHFRNFRKCGAIPAFLQGMLGLIFNRETGRINDDKVLFDANDIPSIVDCVRQICLTFKKMELDCTPFRTSAAFANFIAIEQSLKMFEVPREDRSYFDLVSSVLWDNMLGDLCPDMLVPRNGPGATAERISGNQKYVWQRWHERLEPYFPFLGNAFPLGADESLEFKNVTFVPLDEEQPVRVIPVPKTLKGPRIIAIEPVCNQFVQQAVLSILVKRIETHRLTAGHVNFSDQSINQRLAMSSSIDGQFATIDLSDASDRVPYSLALSMFSANPYLKGLVDACRSRNAEMPDGTIVPLSKFASMGSALCFPVESMYFYTICVAALLKAHNLPVTQRNVFYVSRGVYVYGDDIVVPNTMASTVLDYLQKYNCKVNTNKTFYTGKFRESCGVDAYMGRLVTPTYLNTIPPRNRQQASEVLSWVATARLFEKKGYQRTAAFLYYRVEQVLGPLPRSDDNSQILGRSYSLNSSVRRRWSAVLQRFEIRAWCSRPVYRTDELDSYAALSKSLLSLEAKPEKLNFSNSVFVPRDPKNLERTARYGAVALQRRWLPEH